MNSNKKKEEIKKAFYENTLDLNQLSELEYQFYSQTLQTYKEENKKAFLLYFNNAASFVVAEGKSIFSINKQKEIIKKEFFISHLDLISLGTPIPFSPTEINCPFYTNIYQNTSLFKLILKNNKGVLKLPNISPESFTSNYQDFCGYVQLRGFSEMFSAEKAALTFRDALLKIDTQNKYYPPEIVAAVSLFSLLK